MYKGFMLKINNTILLMSMLLCAGNMQASFSTQQNSILGFIGILGEAVNSLENQRIVTQQEASFLNEENKELLSKYLNNSLNLNKDVGFVFVGCNIAGLVQALREDEHAGMNNWVAAAGCVAYIGWMGQIYYRHKLWKIKKSVYEEIVEPSGNEESVTLDVESQLLLSRQSRIHELDRKCHGNDYKRVSFENK